MVKTKDDLLQMIKECESYLDLSEEVGHLEEALYAGGDVVIWITSDHLGSDQESLGRILMKELLICLAEIGSNLKAVILSNRAVKLEEDPANHQALERLEEQGVALLYCSTSVHRLAIEPELGTRATMFHLLQVALSAKRLLSL